MAIKSADTLKPGGKFPIVESKDIKGGIHNVETIELRNLININLLEVGTLCYVSETGYYYKLIRFEDGLPIWKTLESGTSGGAVGIPLYTTSLLSSLDKESIDLYIEINDPTEEDEANKSLILYLTEALGALQAEVSKLRLSLLLGLNTLQDNNINTLVAGEVEEIEPDVPLEEEEEEEDEELEDTNTEDTSDESVNFIEPDPTKGYYDVGHLSIRTVATKAILTAILKYLNVGELVYVRGTLSLYIVDPDNGLTKITAGSNDDDPDIDDPNITTGMTQAQIIELLNKNGITVTSEGGDLKIASINELDFINFKNADTQKLFKFTTDAYGNLKSTEINTEDTIANRVKNHTISDVSIRGLIGLIGLIDFKKDTEIGVANATEASDIKSYSDRLKIGAVYAPLHSDTIFGCSHAYIELENTSNRDWALDGIYLYYFNGTETLALPLTGILRKGSTYLIRGKLYALFEDANVYIKVETFDQEWWNNGELVDLTIPATGSIKFALVYLPFTLDSTGEPLVTINKDLKMWNVAVPTTPGYKKDKADFTYPNWYIDSFCLTNEKAAGDTWAIKNITTASNSITKNTFELDPAKLAFLALTTYDSSRYRNAKAATDVQIVNLNSEFISFPHTKEKYPISRYTPKASFENKNVSTDKSKLDMNKPNMVTCSFGIDAYTTRCFNWISAGLFNEYVWIKEGETWKKFESYTKISEASLAVQTVPYRKEFAVDVNNAVYARMTGRFPGDNTFYTSHKCIIKLVDEAVSSKTTYTYIVGRANGNLPDLEHCSEEYTFTLYPNAYTPKVYQTTDLQGFHWIEYQVWAAAADAINAKINSDLQEENIIPVLLNTGDMTQNGTRINEWLDYYNAGKNLFKHLEQMNCVGNNDLCGPDFSILGTGDDPGKSNSYYFHVFYCYEVDSTNIPIINNKYVPSLYYFDFKDYRFVMANSEFTLKTCSEWFKTFKDGTVVNVYTGWQIKETGAVYSNEFTSVYTMLYKMLDITDKQIIVACHEMPFTVITTDNILLDAGNKTPLQLVDRSTSGTSLVGSHMNKITTTDGAANYWFSRLLEFMSKKNSNVKIVLGGHKHTYSCTYELRENFYFIVDGEIKNSADNFDLYTMSETLEDDNVFWTYEKAYKAVNNTDVPETDPLYATRNYHTSKFPLTKRSSEGLGDSASDGAEGAAATVFYPYTSKEDLTNGIVYFMCLATGYKLTSNKELPTKYQAFSDVIPLTEYAAAGSTAADALKHPMYLIMTLGTNYNIYLLSVLNIMKSFKFTLQMYDTSAVTTKYFDYDKKVDEDPWVTTEKVIKTI